MTSGHGDGRLKSLVAAASAAVLFTALSAAPAKAGPLLCDGGAGPYDTGTSGVYPGYRCETVSHTYFPGDNVSNTYGFDPYGSFGQFFSFTNELTFDTVLRTFTLFMSAFFVEPGDTDFLDLLPAGAQPETFLTTDGPTWIYFYVEDLQSDDCGPPRGTPGPCGEPQQGTDATNGEYGPDSDLDDDLKAWFQTVTWFSFFGTNSARMLHDPRDGVPFFGNDITVPGSFDPAPDPCDDSEYYGCEPPPPPPCEICLLGGELKAPGDPVITGTANDFSATTIVAPEPATLWLLGLGAAGIFARARRRNKV
jgi:hypothetical protein